MFSIERVKPISEILSTWVGLLALLAGGTFSLIQYVQKDHGERVKETLSFLDRQMRDPVMTARRTLSAAWLKRDPELDRLIDDKASTRDDYVGFVVKVVNEESLYESMIVMIDFYDGLHVCIVNEICDAKVSAELFREDARAFWSLHQPFIARIREKRQDLKFAGNLEAFAVGGSVQ